MLQQKTSYVAPVLLAVSLPDERLRQKPRARCASGADRIVRSTATVVQRSNFIGGGSGPRGARGRGRASPASLRLAFEPALFLEARLPIGSGQHPRADGGREPRPRSRRRRSAENFDTLCAAAPYHTLNST